MNLPKYREFKKTDTIVEKKLYKLGCPKINLFVRNTNIKVKAFYKTNNYKIQDAQIYGKRLIDDN